MPVPACCPCYVMFLVKVRTAAGFRIVCDRCLLDNGDDDGLGRHLPFAKIKDPEKFHTLYRERSVRPWEPAR